MNKKIGLMLSALIFLGIGFTIGAFFATSNGISPVQADPADEMPGSNYYGGYGYGGYGMGMGRGPMYGYYGTGNYSSYYGNYGMGMGMGMGMMGPMMMGPMYGYGINNGTYYGYGGYCPGCGGYGMYGSNPYYYWNNTGDSGMNMTASSSDGNKAIFMTDNSSIDASGSETAQASLGSSPLLIAGLGAVFLAGTPISWKILNRKSVK